MRQGGVLYYFVADHLGSTSVTLDANGNKIGEMKYTPFGETRIGYPTGSVQTDRLFTGQRQENDLGSLYDYGARFYSPVLGRFLSADTIAPDGKNPQQFNRYSYVSNRPLNFMDPTGHYSDEELIKMGVVNGPNVLQQMKESEDPSVVAWYWFLRAANDGDNLVFSASDIKGFDIGGAVNFSSKLESSDNGLMFVGADGTTYGVKDYGLADLADSKHYFGVLGSSAKLTKVDSTVLNNTHDARRYAQLVTHRGSRAPGDFDYTQTGFGVYAGVGGGFAFKRDRYGHVYLTLSLGIGIGGKGGNVTVGNYTTDYVPDETELQGYMSGSSITLSGSVLLAENASMPSGGPLGVDAGAGFPGFAGTVDFTIMLR